MAQNSVTTALKTDFGELGLIGDLNTAAVELLELCKQDGEQLERDLLAQ